MKFVRPTSCSTNRVMQAIRILLSLAIIVYGIVTRNWLGLFGVITLLSALTGSCSLALRFGPDPDKE
jgi:hypothetical protein